MTLSLSIKYPAQLISIIQIVETGDRILLSKSREPTFKPRSIEAIKLGIDKKFNEKLKDY